LDWTVRICNFGHSVAYDYLWPHQLDDADTDIPWSKVMSRYLAPESYDNIIVPESDVFSFGLILYELIIGRPAFPKHFSAYEVAGRLAAKKWHPDIPECVIPEAADLIQHCLAKNYRLRPSFFDILYRLEKSQFKLMADVNSAKVAAFVDEIENSEE
jgi:serine/threonine protein kinase